MQVRGTYRGNKPAQTKTGKTIYFHTMEVDGKNEEFSSFTNEAFKDAVGKDIGVEITVNGKYKNLVENAEVQVFGQAKIASKEEKAEQAIESVQDVAGILNQATDHAISIAQRIINILSDERKKELEAGKVLEVVASMAMHISNNYHRKK